MSKKWYDYFVVTSPTDAPSAETSPADVPARPARAADLVPDAEGDATFTEPVAAPADSVDLEALYRSAKIQTPAHGYTVLKVAEMLQSEHIRALPADVKQKSILVALDAAGVKVAEIVEDAVQRDRALDTYERVLQKHLEDLRAQKDRENKQIEEEINQRVAELRARIDAEPRRDRQGAGGPGRLARPQARRRGRIGIRRGVGYFVSPNPITDDRPRRIRPKDKGGTDVR